MDTSKFELLTKVAPGTDFRKGIENVQLANTGGLIVVGYGPVARELIHGGFELNHPYSPESLYELAKMDGAIVLSEDARLILLANAQLNPDVSIQTNETGTRHRAAERFAIQTNELVISISKRRNTITLYKGRFRYLLRNIDSIINKANQALQRLEKLKAKFDTELKKLTYMEINRMVTLHDVVQLLHLVQRMIVVQKELEAYVAELGVEGAMIEVQARDTSFEKEAQLLIKDYMHEGNKATSTELFHILAAQSSKSNESSKDTTLTKLLGFSSSTNIADEQVIARGYRVCSKIHRIPSSVVANMIHKIGHINGIMDVPIAELIEVEGIGEVRAHRIKAWFEANKTRDILW